MTGKRLRKFAAAAALIFALTSLSACSNSEEETSSGTAEGTAESTAEAEPAAKLGFIYNGSADEMSFTGDCNKQRIAAEQYTNIESEYIERVNVGDFEQAVKMLVEDGCTHIVSGSPVYANALGPVSKNYMNINFIDYGSESLSSNIYAYTESVYQAAFVAGMAAAYNSETEKIGVVADPSMLYHIQCTNAVQLGAKNVFSTVETILATARKNEEIHRAVDALANKGCDVIISYTESGETVEYCEQKGIKVIGCLDYSGIASNYKNMLMYFYSSRDSFFLAQYKAMEREEWQPLAYMGSVGNGVVNISDALPAAKQDTQAILDNIVPKVASGDAYIFRGQLKDYRGVLMIREGSAYSISEILAMNWYVEGVDLSLETFIVSREHPEVVELVIKK